jgi:hypothetical protein
VPFGGFKHSGKSTNVHMSRQHYCAALTYTTISRIWAWSRADLDLGIGRELGEYALEVSGLVLARVHADSIRTIPR